jgi:hypothetical protein
MRRALLIAALVALLAPATAAASPYSDAVSASAPWGWWRLGETAGTTAADVRGLSAGTWSTGVTPGVDGALAGDDDPAAALGGGGGLSLGATFNPTGPLTMESWVNLANRTSTRYVLSKGTGTAGFHLLVVNGAPTLRVSTSSATTTITAPTALTAGTWHHLAGAFGAGTMTLYVDGAPVATRAVSGTLRTSTLPLTAGRYSSGGSGLNGRLDEPAVYDRALPGAELAEHAAAGLAAQPAAVAVGAGPATRTDDRGAAFALTRTDPQGTFTCALDGATPAPCSASPSYAGLSDGPHALAVAGADRWGRPAVGTTYAWTVDQRAAADYDPSPPDTRIDASTGPATASTDATFVLSASRTRSTFACALDGGAFAPCTATVVLHGVATGDHVLRVRATDRFGQTDPDPAEFAWTVDRTTPDTALALVGAGTAAFAATEPGGFQCRFGDGAWTECTSPATVPAGTDLVSVRAVDAAGNADPSPANVRPPGAAAGEPTGAGTFTSTGARLTFAVSAGGRPECRLDDAAWAACASPMTVAGLAWGEHAFAVRATFANGLSVAAPEQRWTAAAPGARIAALQFPVLLHRARDGRARARGRAPSLRFALNVAVPVKVRVDRVRGRRSRAVATWTVPASRGDHVVRVGDKVLRRLKRGRYRIAAQPAGGASARLAFAVV